MSKKCAKCEKTVYPTEELKCLDKIWHKPCFKCKECGMALNMRNYKGFNKEPYCEAHIPKAKATTMAETPELKRIAENTKLQSNVKYHADFERSKGKFTQVADDPETLRIKQNTKIISNVAYHGDKERKAAMEQRRQMNENGWNQQSDGVGNNNNIPVTDRNKNANMAAVVPEMAPPAPPPLSTLPTLQHNNPYNIGKICDYEPQTGGGGGGGNGSQQPQFNSPYSSRNTTQTLIYSSDQGGQVLNNPPQRSNIGSVHDIDPVNHNYGSLGRMYKAMYDYEAQDEDEVSFQDGDLIVNVSSIEGGWMTGEVQRTGKIGMLPANYVQVVNI